MITQDKRLLGGVAGAVLLAAVGGFSVARCTADPATEAQTAGKTEAEAEAHTDKLVMTAEAIRAADIAVEAVRAGGLGSEILAQATVTASPTGEAIVTARAGGVVIRVSKRLGDPVKAGEALAVVKAGTPPRSRQTGRQPKRGQNSPSAISLANVSSMSRRYRPAWITSRRRLKPLRLRQKRAERRLLQMLRMLRAMGAAQLSQVRFSVE